MVRIRRIAIKGHDFIDRVNCYAKEDKEDAEFITILKKVFSKEVGTEDLMTIIKSIRERKPNVMRAI